MVTNIKINTLLVFLCALLTTPIAAQTAVWPGDVNNNGVVNNIDMLYWGLAKESTGPSRAATSDLWQEEQLDVLWTANFADGINFGFADCNGDGIVDDDDLEVIKMNFDSTNAQLNPDVFQTGEPSTDPILLLDPLTTDVIPGDTAKIRLSLGDTLASLDEFFGIAFTLNFDPDRVEDETTGVNKKVLIDFTEDNWIDQAPPNHARVEVQVDNEAGTAQVAIMRRNPGTNAGSGEFGVLSIVMVDIVLLQDETTPFSVEKIKLINPNLEEVPIAPSEAEINLLSDTTTSYTSLAIDSEIKTYPNPAKEGMWVETLDHTNTIKAIEIFNAFGLKLYSKKRLQPQTKHYVQFFNYPSGVYLMRIETAKGVFTKLIIL